MSFRVSWSSSTTRTVSGCFAGNEGDSEIGGLVGVPGRIECAVSLAAGATVEVSPLGGTDKVSDSVTKVPGFASDKVDSIGSDCSSEVDAHSSLDSRSHRCSGLDGVISTRPSVEVISGVHGNNVYRNVRCSIIVRCVKCAVSGGILSVGALLGVSRPNRSEGTSSRSGNGSPKSRMVEMGIGLDLTETSRLAPSEEGV